MSSIIGIDSRSFVRDVTKRNGSPGHFESVLGIAVKVRDYEIFDKKYKECLESAFSSYDIDFNYQYYCANDMKSIQKRYEILDVFVKKISEHIEKIHVFYTLFSKKQIESVRVYGRLAERKQIKLAAPFRTYEQLISQHLIQCFPAICA